MPATPASEIVQPCFSCLGLSMADSLLVSLWQNISDNMACNGALESMTSVGGVTINSYVGLPVIDFNSLTLFSGRLIWTDSPGITEFNFPVMTSYVALVFDIRNNTTLTTVTLPVVIFANTGIIVVATNCALSPTSIEGFLRRGVLSGLTTANLDFTGGTSATLAQLTLQGQADAATLTLAGCTLNFNP